MELLPIDEQGFTKSFNIDDFDLEEAAKFFQKYGVIVFNDIISE